MIEEDNGRVKTTSVIGSFRFIDVESENSIAGGPIRPRTMYYLACVV